jgi:hypothetical protein
MQNIGSIKEVVFMQDPMSFQQFARQLPKVFDTIAKRGEKVLVEKDGMLFRLEPEKKPQDIWATYDPEKVREGLRKSAGALKGVDAERASQSNRINGTLSFRPSPLPVREP